LAAAGSGYITYPGGDGYPLWTAEFLTCVPPLQMEGGTTFHFVDDGIESALAHARDAAGGQDIWLAGGASVVNQYLAAGLVDEIDVAIVSVIVGAGARLFEGLERGQLTLKQIRAVDAPGVTHIKYEVS
jgi:dihydrofolate reductase